MINNNSKKILTHPSLVFAGDLQAICAPLKALNIFYFSHVRVDKAGAFSALGLRPEFVKLYLDKKYYNFDIHMAQLRLSEQYILWDTIERKKESEQLYNDFKDFGLGHTFTIIQENKDNKECFHFSTKLGSGSINHCYLQNIDLLKKFINYFNEKINGHKGLRSGYDIKFQVEPDRGGYFTKEEFAQISYSEFNQKVQADRLYIDKDRYLTKRELECLYWLAKGKILEEAATILNITPRTIKAHISNIKEKFSCHNQFQLGMLYQELSKLNIIF